MNIWLVDTHLVNRQRLVSQCPLQRQVTQKLLRDAASFQKRPREHRSRRTGDTGAVGFWVAEVVSPIWVGLAYWRKMLCMEQDTCAAVRNWLELAKQIHVSHADSAPHVQLTAQFER